MIEPNQILDMTDHNKAVLASTEAAIAVAIEHETRARQVLDDATSTHRSILKNLETLRMNAQRMREFIATKAALALLPAELIEQIVVDTRDSLLFPDDPTGIPLYPVKFMLGLLAVCSRWRNVLREAPRVWQILPMQPYQQNSVGLAKYLRPLVRNATIHWWLNVRSTSAGFKEDMETFQKAHSDCMFKDGQFKLLTLVFEPCIPGCGWPLLQLRAPSVTTLVAGITTRHTSDPDLESNIIPQMWFGPEALPALETLELRGITSRLAGMILPHLHTFIARASPINLPPAVMLDYILEHSPRLSKLEVDHCVYTPSTDSAEPQQNDLPKVFLTITTLELDLLGVNSILIPLAESSSIDYEFRDPIKRVTLVNHLYRLPTPASRYSPAFWKRMKVDYDPGRVKKILSKMHGVEQLYLRTGGRVVPDPKVPFTFSFQADNLAPLKDVQELIFQCADGSLDEVCVTLEGVRQNPNLFPRLRKIRLERCKKMTAVWESLLETVRVRTCIVRVELVDCGVALGACPELDSLLTARRA